MRFFIKKKNYLLIFYDKFLYSVIYEIDLQLDTVSFSVILIQKVPFFGFWFVFCGLLLVRVR